MLFEQFVDDDLGCASYLVGDEDAGVAVVVDPAYEIGQYVEEADRRGVRLTRVLETHTHADHVSGHGRFALEHGLPVSVHPAAEPEFPFDPLEDGAEIELGEIVVQVLHTPGHRPEHCAFAVVDRSRAEEPWLVLTGDSLFVGDTGRPDLAVDARDGAEGLSHSLARLSDLADGVEVYPGHVAGSLCGAALSSKPSSTIGFERRFNASFALAARARDEFLAQAANGHTPRPANMERIVALNRGRFVGAPHPLGPAASTSGATVLDVRPAREFAAGHERGALNVPLRSGGFATKAGFVLSPDEPIVIRARSREEAEEAARGLRSVGFLELAGYVFSGDDSARLQPVELDELERLVGAGAVELVDVREQSERDSGYIPGSRHIPYRLVATCSSSVPRDRPVVTMCESGSRATVAASVLAAAGFDARPLLGAGVGDWQERGLPIVEQRRCGS